MKTQESAWPIYHLGPIHLDGLQSCVNELY